MPTYDYLCSDCGITEVVIVRYEDRDEKQLCSYCGRDTMARYYGKMPGITRASYIDSNKTARAKELVDLKRAAKLEVDKAGMRAGDRAEVNKEIRKLKEIK